MQRRLLYAESVMLLVLILCYGSAQGQGLLPIQERNGLINAFARMKAGKPTTIAYFGGSITEGAGASDANKTCWRAQTTAWFRRQYPKTAITEINAAIGVTGSTLGAFRLQRDVLDKKPDLVFVEFDGYSVEFRVPVEQINERNRRKDAVEFAFAIDALDFKLVVGLSDIVSFGELQGLM